MHKYLGDAIIKGNLSVQTDKPLDSRLVVQDSNELYGIDPTYAYVGMPVVSITDNTIFILKDKSKINLPSGWKKVSGDASQQPNPQPDSGNEPQTNQQKWIVLEEREYNSLEQKDANTLYFITEDEEVHSSGSRLGEDTFPLVLGGRSSRFDQDTFPLILD